MSLNTNENTSGMVRSYTFENPFRSSPGLKEKHGENKAVFLKNLGIPATAKLDVEEKMILDAFFHDNIYNIEWYRKRIRKERRTVNLYLIFTLVILLGMPVLIFFVTLYEWGEGSGMADLESSEKIGSGLTVMLSAVLALHKFTSTWIDSRKFAAQFHKAGSDLKDVLYELQVNFFGRATTGDKSFGSLQKKRQFGDDFFAALKNASKLSKSIVNAETQAYFEKQANPTFDISGIWRSSVANARDAFGSFKSASWNVEELRQQVKKHEAGIADAKAEIDKKEQLKEIALLKIQRLSKQAETVSLQIDDLEAKQSKLDGPGLTRLEQLRVKFDNIDKEIDDGEFSIRVLELEIARLKSAAEN
jgi:hypothetical protein